MKKETIKTVILTATDGKLLVKYAEAEHGEYELGGKRYNVHSGVKIHTPENDVENWSEVNSLEEFLQNFTKVDENG